MAQDQQQEQPLDAIFGTQATVRVLRALAPGDEHAPPRLAVRTGLSRPAVREALIRLEREGIIQRVGTGRHVLYRLASDYPLTKRIVKLFKAEAKRASALIGAAVLAATITTRANAQGRVEIRRSVRETTHAVELLDARRTPGLLRDAAADHTVPRRAPSRTRDGDARGSAARLRS